MTAQVQYTTGVGVAGGALMDGVRGSLVQGLDGHEPADDGQRPAADARLSDVGQRHGRHRNDPRRADRRTARRTAATGTILNPAAYSRARRRAGGATPGGTRCAGPTQFTLNSGLSRTFLLGERLNLDWRIDATNVLNRVTYASINTIVGSPQFGLPNRANPMRKLQTSLRLRF